MDYSAFQPFSRFVEIDILGRRVQVPENNTLLRCFQHLEPRLPYGPWCWNGDCGASRITFRARGAEGTKVGLACQILVHEGIEILEMSPELRRALAVVLAPPREEAVEAGPVSSD